MLSEQVNKRDCRITVGLLYVDTLRPVGEDQDICVSENKNARLVVIVALIAAVLQLGDTGDVFSEEFSLSTVPKALLVPVMTIRLRFSDEPSLKSQSKTRNVELMYWSGKTWYSTWYSGLTTNQLGPLGTR